MNRILKINRRNFIFISILMAALIAALFISFLADSGLGINILSPVNVLFAAAILFFAYLKTDHKIKVSITFLLFSIACLIAGIADILRAVLILRKIIPEENVVLSSIYLLSSSFIFTAVLIIIINQFHGWDRIQLGVDLLSIGYLTVYLVWILFFRKDIEVFKGLMKFDITIIPSMAIDIFIGVCTISWFISQRKGDSPTFLYIIATGLLTYAFVDMLNYYLTFTHLNFPIRFIFFLYTLSLCIIAFASLWKSFKANSPLDISVLKNIGANRRWVALLFFPSFMVIAVLTGFSPVRLGASEFFAVGGAILFYWAASKYIQVSLEKEALLTQNNEMLEKKVNEQVEKLMFLANQDSLTKLYNRNYAYNYLEEVMLKKSESETVTLFIVDLDRFKMINDTFGHDIGDYILIEVANRLNEWNKYDAVIARIGGDEFTLMLTGEYSKEDIETFSEEIIKKCTEPIKIRKDVINLTVSIGAAITETDTHTAKQLMQNADIAMFRAKSKGYNEYQIYDAYISQDFKMAARIEALLRQSDTEKDFVLYYQPQYLLSDLTLIGAEALIRWESHEHGFIPPNIFIPIAEKIGYIIDIGKWVMSAAIRQSIIWNQVYNRQLKIGFNVSPKQLSNGSFIDIINTLIVDSGIDPEWIDAEITESIMIDEGKEIDKIFKFMKKKCISVSIDDFGSGYSSLGSLNKYSFDRVKIDKTLIDNLSSGNETGKHVVEAAINFAHAANIKVIAEGVETQEQLDILKELGCDQVQGYFLGRPVPADVFLSMYINAA